ncbi:hypothetical protein IM538_03935 [Cytobacillus suaedae]|nr:hypothetical protein IM538_03935 [Cytobacillus suaedae]
MRKVIVGLLIMLGISGCSIEEKETKPLEEIDVINTSMFHLPAPAARFESNRATIYHTLPTTAPTNPSVLLYDGEIDKTYDYDLLVKIEEAYDELILESEVGSATISVDWDAFSRKQKNLFGSKEFVKQTAVIEVIYDMLHKKQLSGNEQ